jgi:glycosyltransferase involved in cell wall biosynthesis
VLKFAKYLPANGWQPLVVTVRDGHYPARDESLCAEVPDECRVYPTMSAEPYQLYRRFVGMRPDENIPGAVLAEPEPSLRHTLANLVRLNLFVPDARIGWLPWGLERGLSIAREHQVDAILSSSPPATAHLIARGIARRTGLPWVADFRDPWSEIHFYQGKLRLGPMKRLDRALEQSVLDEATRLLFVSRGDLARARERLADPDKCHFIPNGYDEGDFAGLPQKRPLGGPFTLMHLGAVGRERTPTGLIEAIAKMKAEGRMRPESFRLEFVGEVEPSVRGEIERAGITEYVHYSGYRSHREALALASSAGALLLLITHSKNNSHIIPGKTFEYLRLGQPLMVYGPQAGETARVVEEISGEPTLDYHDVGTSLRWLRAALERRTEAPSSASTTSRVQAVRAYERAELTAKLARILEQATSGSA